MVNKMNNSISDNTRILVVDDEERIRDVCQTMLTQEGFKTEVAKNGSLGLNMIKQEHFDIVLLDLMMPGMSGMDVLNHIKDAHPDTVVIVITGYATLEHGIDAMKKGAFEFLPKPFAPEDLRLVIKKAIDYLKTLQDISNEKSRMRTLINHLADGVMATDSEKKVALANPAFLKMVGRRGKGVIGSPVDSIIKNDTVIKMIDEALDMPADAFTELTEEFDHGSLAPDENKALGLRCVPFRDRLGRNLGTITVIHDITTLKKMDQHKSDFVSMVAHEIQSPMNSVLMQIKNIIDGLAGEVSEKQHEILSRVTARIKALSNLSSELLDLAKIESGLIIQEKERINLAEILEEQTAFHQAKSQAKGIELMLCHLPSLKPVLGNRENIEEVVSNLIGNGIKYTPEGGKVEVSAGQENGHVCISVRDTGFGIPKKDHEKIFERFYRVKNKDTRFIPGTGLGLSIVKKIIEAHNGTITVESKPGQGAIFTVYFPATTNG